MSLVFGVGNGFFKKFVVIIIILFFCKGIFFVGLIKILIGFIFDVLVFLGRDYI